MASSRAKPYLPFLRAKVKTSKEDIDLGLHFKVLHFKKISTYLTYSVSFIFGKLT